MAKTYPLTQKLKCKLCDKLCSTKLSILRHITAVHSNTKDYQCLICKKCFARKQTIQNHIEAVHKICQLQSSKSLKTSTPKSLMSDVERQNFIQRGLLFCSVCDYMCCPKRALMKHFNAHHTSDQAEFILKLTQVQFSISYINPQYVDTVGTK